MNCEKLVIGEDLEGIDRCLGEIAGFRCGLPESFHFLDYYALNMGLIDYPETSVLNQPTLRNDPEDGRTQIVF